MAARHVSMKATSIIGSINRYTRRRSGYHSWASTPPSYYGITGPTARRCLWSSCADTAIILYRNQHIVAQSPPQAAQRPHQRPGWQLLMSPIKRRRNGMEKRHLDDSTVETRSPLEAPPRSLNFSPTARAVHYARRVECRSGTRSPA